MSKPLLGHFYGAAAIAIVVAMAALGGCRQSSPASGALDYNEDIAPLLWEHCGSCHRPGGVAPFSVLDYASVRAHARQIATVTRKRLMPPWLPEHGYGAFADERRLGQIDIDRVGQWVQEGAVEGGPAVRRSPPRWTDEWQLGRPDLVVELREPYRLRAGGTDVFRNFVIPLQLDRTRYVRGIEFRPGSRGVIHHATILFDRTRQSRRLDELDPEPGFEGTMFSEGTQNPDAHAIGWAPGKTAYLEPENMGWRLEKRSDLIVQLHMIPSGKPETIQPSIGLVFTDAAPSQISIDFKLGSKLIDIPAGTSAYVVEDEYTMPVDVDVLSIYPHAHYLAHDVSAFATLPNGKTAWLIWIKEWNFNWQDEYRYATPVFLPKGTRVTMRYSYDNSDGNKRSPTHPPKRVSFGPASTDEMADLWLRLLPRNSADAPILADAYRQRELLKSVEFAETMVANQPREARWHALIGARYVQIGRIDEGIAALRQAIRLDPSHAEANNNLGQALLQQGRPAEAIPHFRTAIRLMADNDETQFNLGNALQDTGSLNEAIDHYRRSIALNPEVAAVHNNLGAALAARGDVNEASSHFRRALELQPDYPDARRNLELVRRLRASPHSVR